MIICLFIAPNQSGENARQTAWKTSFMRVPFNVNWNIQSGGCFNGTDVDRRHPYHLEQQDFKIMGELSHG
jgi:hypothetical protein